MEKMYCIQYDSPIGKLLLTCTDAGLTGLYMNWEAPVDPMEHPILHQTRRWLDAYFRGEEPAVDLPLHLEGTDFQRRVWKILLTIPCGQTRTYGEISREMAQLLGKEKMSAQAVGQAVGKNPISILIPCHRVVGSKGHLTGYAWGLEKKIWLLRHEGHQIANDIVG